MATVNYSISNSVKDSWNGYFTVDSLSSAVSDFNAISAIGAGPGLFSFTPVQFEMYPDNPGSDVGRTYVTWRSISFPDTQFPGAGYSLDVWSESLYTAINAGETWNNLISTGTFNLSNNKWTVVYNYDPPYPLFHGLNGTISFTAG